MKDRYKNSKVLKDIDSKRYYSTTIYPEIDKKVSDFYIISRKGDRLDALANKYYQDVTKWTIIAQANHIGKGTMIIQPGLQIRIPIVISELDNDLEQINENR